MSSQTSLPDETVFSLIREIESHPCLWQKSHRHFKNAYKKNDAIAQIAVILDLTEDMVKDKIRSLRTIYFQNAQKAKKGKSGSGGGSQPKWKFYNALSFLQGEVAECGAVDNMQLNATDADESAAASLDSALEIERPLSSMSTQSQASSTGSAGTPTAYSKKRKAAIDDDRRACWNTLLESISQKGVHEEFGNYVSTTLAQIKEENLVERTKAQIQIILAKALTESAEKQLTSNVEQVLVFDSDGRIISDSDVMIEEVQN